MNSKSLINLLRHHHDGKLGYVVYRCTYEDDQKWAEFMERLTDHVTAALNSDGADDGGELIRDSWAWDVRERQAEFDGASKADICRHFNEWVASVGGYIGYTKYACCIYADAEVVDSVLSAYDPKTTSAFTEDSEPFVKLINYRLCGIVEQQAAEQATEKEPQYVMTTDAKYEYVDGVYQYIDATRELLEEDGSGLEAVDGCTCWDVGWQKVAPYFLLPRAYALWCEGGWELYYERPPTTNMDL